jgi:hypothetical protein
MTKQSLKDAAHPLPPQAAHTSSAAPQPPAPAAHTLSPPWQSPTSDAHTSSPPQHPPTSDGHTSSSPRHPPTSAAHTSSSPRHPPTSDAHTSSPPRRSPESAVHSSSPPRQSRASTAHTSLPPQLPATPATNNSLPAILPLASAIPTSSPPAQSPVSDGYTSFTSPQTPPSPAHTSLPAAQPPAPVGHPSLPLVPPRAPAPEAATHGPPRPSQPSPDPASVLSPTPQSTDCIPSDNHTARGMANAPTDAAHHDPTHTLPRNLVDPVDLPPRACGAPDGALFGPVSGVLPCENPAGPNTGVALEREPGERRSDGKLRACGAPLMADDTLPKQAHRDLVWDATSDVTDVPLRARMALRAARAKQEIAPQATSVGLLDENAHPNQDNGSGERSQNAMLDPAAHPLSVRIAGGSAQAQAQAPAPIPSRGDASKNLRPNQAPLPGSYTGSGNPDREPDRSPPALGAQKGRTAQKRVGSPEVVVLDCTSSSEDDELLVLPLAKRLKRPRVEAGPNSMAPLREPSKGLGERSGSPRARAGIPRTELPNTSINAEGISFKDGLPARSHRSLSSSVPVGAQSCHGGAVPEGEVGGGGAAVGVHPQLSGASKAGQARGMDGVVARQGGQAALRDERKAGGGGMLDPVRSPDHHHSPANVATGALHAPDVSQHFSRLTTPDVDTPGFADPETAPAPIGQDLDAPASGVQWEGAVDHNIMSETPDAETPAFQPAKRRVQLADGDGAHGGWRARNRVLETPDSGTPAPRPAYAFPDRGLRVDKGRVLATQDSGTPARPNEGGLRSIGEAARGGGWRARKGRVLDTPDSELPRRVDADARSGREPGASQGNEEQVAGTRWGNETPGPPSTGLVWKARPRVPQGGAEGAAGPQGTGHYPQGTPGGFRVPLPVSPRTVGAPYACVLFAGQGTRIGFVSGSMQS